jgi:beta-N-acetylhexosaminidase
MMRSLVTTLFILLTSWMHAQQIYPLRVEKDYAKQEKWVDSVYHRMTLEEKFGQLFMVDLFSSAAPANIEKVRTLIKEQYIGGIIFSKGGPIRQANLNNEFQALSKVPLLIGMDAEWGLAMRLDSTFAYPWNMTLGAIKDDRIVEQIGERIGVHCKRLGVHFNFAPVVDINTNPDNPIIGNRSFGEDRVNVTQKAISFMKGLQKAGILANAKHFPGHGDTDTDSHKTLPTLDFDRSRLDSVELYPYRAIINEGLSSVMIAHLNIPALVSETDYPSSISKDVVTGLLQEDLGFHGLIFTDALSMKGASNFKDPGEIDLAAFLAGNDVLLIPQDVPKAHALLLKSYEDGTISEERLAHSVKKILMAKYKVGLNKYQPVSTVNLVEDLNTPEDLALYEKAMERAITVIANDQLVLPIRELQNTKIAYVNFGDDTGEPFLTNLNKYAAVDWIQAESLEEYLQKLDPYDYVVIGFHKSNENPWKDYKLSEDELSWMSEIAKNHKVILDLFARPYALLDLKDSSNFEAVIVSYQNSEIAQSISAQIIFGARSAKGILPVSVGTAYPAGTSIETTHLKRLQYGTPESVGMDSEALKQIDTLATKGYYNGMYPGAQIVVARKGKVIYQRSFGYHTQDKLQRVKDTDLYDLASLTKILATLPMVMQLFDQKVINMDTKLSEILPEYKNSNKKDITLKRMLSHYARLKAWIPFYTKTLDSITGGPSMKYYSRKWEQRFSRPVASELYMRNDYSDSIYEEIRLSELNKSDGYKYSDLPFYILKKYLEKYYSTPLNKLVQRDIYQSLGANYTTYKPLERFDLDQIAPTEQDNSFRMQKIQGYVHDQGAAMLGGVGGHAGLFSNANDVAKIMQMYLWKGYYGGKEYISPETLDAFNTCYFCDKNVRRGVGFDKPQLGSSGPTCGCVSMTSFGHSGFTGTFAWADPEEEIVYVFLSNRTFPDVENRMLISSNLRSNIQEAIYDAIKH